MIKHVLLAVGLLVSAVSCDNKRDRPPTEAERKAAVAAESEARALEAAKAREDQKLKTAEARKDIAGENAEAAREKSEDTADNVGVDWRAPEEGWTNDFATFAEGRERIFDKGDYAIERDADGSIVAYRRTKQVAGEAFDAVKSAALVAQVKTKLAADPDVKATQINVDAEDHVVKLTGNVDNARAAGEAVRLALSTPGTERVVSLLTWPRNK